MMYRVKVAADVRGPWSEWAGWYLLAPMEGCTDNKYNACLYSKEELEEELYIADGIEHGLFEVEPVFDSIPGYYSY